MFSEVHSIKRFVESKYLTIKLVNLTFTVVSYLVFKSHRSAWNMMFPVVTTVVWCLFECVSVGYERELC